MPVCSEKREYYKSPYFEAHSLGLNRGRGDDSLSTARPYCGRSETATASTSDEGRRSSSPNPHPLKFNKAGVHHGGGQALAWKADAAHVVATCRDGGHLDAIEGRAVRPVDWTSDAHAVRPHHVALHRVHVRWFALAGHVEKALDATAPVVRSAAPRPQPTILAEGCRVDVRAADGGQRARLGGIAVGRPARVRGDGIGPRHRLVAQQPATHAVGSEVSSPNGSPKPPVFGPRLASSPLWQVPNVYSRPEPPSTMVCGPSVPLTCG